MRLNDPALFRSQNLVNGDWRGEGMSEIRNPATGALLAKVPHGGAEQAKAAVEAAQRGAKRLGGALGKAARRDHAQVVRPHPRGARGSGADHDQRAGQAARRGARRDRLCRVLHRILRRGGQAHLWRDHSFALAGRAHPRAAPADRRDGGDHALEFSGGDDHPQMRAGARGRLHLRHQTRAGDAADGARPGRTGAARRFSARRAQCRHRRRRRHRPGLLRARGGALRRLHRLDRSRQAADAAGRLGREEGWARTGRQCALHRVRRRRSRRGGRGRAAQQVPQHGPDLRLRQPASMCRMASTTPSRKSSPPPWAS